MTNTVLTKQRLLFEKSALNGAPLALEHGSLSVDHTKFGLVQFIKSER